MNNSFSWNTNDGLKIYGIDWPVNQAKAVVLIIHGLGEHVHRYEHLVAYLHSHKIAAIGYDRRGHGRSEGKKGHTASYSAFLDEVDHLLAETKGRYKNLPVFLYGHSMGGNIVLNYILERNPSVKGVVATGPHIRLSFQPNAITLALGKMMKNIFPGFTQNNGLDATQISRDPDVVQTYLDDPYVHDQLTAITGISLLEKAAVLDAYSAKFPTPLLLMHGSKDGITAPGGTKDFAERVSGDVTLKIWDGFYHEIHNEKEQGEVFDRVVKWMEERI